MENHYFQWENPLQMVIFNSYVKLPEGIHWLIFVPATRITHYVDLYILVCWFVGHA